MKKLSVIILAAMSMFTATASAQLKWGISGGLNVNKVSMSENLFESSNRTGWFVGPKVEFSFPVLPIAINGAAYYAQTSAKLTEKLTTDNNSVSLTQKTVQVPINLKWNIGLGETASFYLAAGPQFDFNIGDKNSEIKYNNTVLGNIETKASQFSVNIGAGVNLMGNLELGVVYNVPCSDSSEGSIFREVKNSTDYGKNHTWKVMASIYF
ncbi:MAG: porin family protein [Paludibacteraceae bacterium]|nr:porin family protein [Paludibacteraceae bacterium]